MLLGMGQGSFRNLVLSHFYGFKNEIKFSQMNKNE
jgi:hypothetical protein